MPKLKLLLVVIDLILIHTCTVDSSNVYYITPLSTAQCPEEFCLTLSTLVANSSNYCGSNTTMVFLEGSHTLDSELVVSNIDGSLTLSTNGSGTVAISCNDSGSLEFSNISQLQISRLEFIRCSSMVELVDQFTLEDSRFYGGNDNSALDLTNTTTLIVRSSFVSNTAGTYQSLIGVVEFLRDNYNDFPYYGYYDRPTILSNSTRVGGALIVTSSTVSISGSHFENNTAEVGGAIFLELGSNINISNCTFVNNSATGCSDDSCHGGALFIDSGCTVIAHNSIFMNNTASFGGGAIALFQGTFSDTTLNVFSSNKFGNSGRYGGVMYASYSSSITVGNSSFDNNEAGNGGGVMSASYSSNITVGNSSFDNNEARRDGGVMFATFNSSITVGNSSFDNNEARHDGRVVYASDSSSITVGNSSFDNNEADSNGGVMFATFSSSITVGNSSFDNNEAGRDGGVMYASDSSSITVGNSSFDNNEAGSDGGVMFATFSSSITVGNSSFDNNEAERVMYRNYYNNGGVMYASYSSSITVGSSSFDNNEAGSDGGVMYASDSSSITVGNSSFDNNEAGSNGGVMFATFSSSITVGNSSFDNNEARHDGGVMYRYYYYYNNGGVMYASYSSSITVGSSSFDNNEAGYHGGVMCAFSSSSITVGKSSFDNNEAGLYGGVMYAFDSSSITVGNSSFDNNEVGGDGGVMYVSNSRSITVGNSSFDNNEAGGDGGVIHAYYSSSITVGNSYFDNNEAGDDGGVMYVPSSSSITVGNSFFDNNTAGGDGGVMYASSSSSITVGDSDFDNNTAGNDGGVMYASNSTSVTMDNSSFDNNEAGNDGGVMYAPSSRSISVGNSSFDNNEAGGDRGVMYASYSRSISVGNSYFDNNEAGGDGGVMYASYSSSITVGNSYFDNNEAGSDGGVMYASYSSSITVGNSYFDNNEAGDDGGVMYVPSSSSITVGNSFFDNNTAGGDGGVMYASSSSSITVGDSDFDNNTAGDDGGVMYAYSSSIISIDTIIIFCTFFNNSAHEGGVVYMQNAYFKDLGSMYSGNMASNGGVITLNDGSLEVTASKFSSNTARNSGGVLYIPLHYNTRVMQLETSHFINNSAISGGAIAMFSNAAVTVTETIFTHNNAIRGGAMYALIGNNLTANYSNFSHNSAKSDGGVIYSENQNRLKLTNCELNFNRADSNGGVVCLLSQSEFNITEDNSFIGNHARSGGVAYISESTTNINSQTLMMANNTAIETGGAVYLSAAILTFFSGNSRLIQNQARSGGAMHLYKANLSFASGANTMLVSNAADDGGALYARESEIIVISQMDSQTNIFANSAVHHGGGLYLTMSELKIRGENSCITRNRASKNGGGIHATNSTIIIEGAVYFVSNEAKNGGGVSLERSAKLHGKNGHINFVTNMASHYGGATYVNDETNPDMCAAVNIESTVPSTESECFSKSVFFNMSDNSAGVSGSNLFGGLLDRCTVQNESKLGIISFENSSNIDKSQLDSITSHPVRLCFCRDGQPNCNYQPEPIQVNRGNLFSVGFIAYDQVHHAVDARIQCFLNSSAGGLGEGQQIQNINKACTELKYKLFTPNDYEELAFSPVSAPCNNISGISERSIIIEIICSCPIGFQISNNNEISCDCICHHVLQSYEKTECNPTTESIIRRENFWISYINNTWSNSSGYIIYPHCPFDYCYTPDKQVSINLNLPNGLDAQCDLNRTGALCGTCKPGYSVSLGSSKCICCPHYWPALLVTIAIVFILSGIGFVAFLLALNLTVAIGTLNAIIFYANIVAANKSALFPSGVSFASVHVFISWLNFDLGFDICFFYGMDTYIKTWLQLAFPAYIIILVVVIIQLSYYFDVFGRLVGKKDPVATLATLILLCYAKLLQIIITAFSSATLVYPDGSKKTLWLPDATIEYFTGKHAVLFFTAILILLAGLVYTLLLFSWQWFLYCPRKRVKLIRNQKLSSFMEIYHVPYTPKHRYWTGLLLLIRVSIYLVSAFNPSGDPRVTLSATTFIMSSLVVYIATFGIRVYKNRFINAVETLTYFNIIALSIFTWYTIDADTNQTAVTNISVGITFIQLIAVIIYHVCKHTNQKLFAKIQGSTISIKMKEKLIRKKQKRVYHKPVPADEDIHQFYELLDMIDSPANTNDYNIKPKSAGPTQSVVERPKSQLAPATPPSPKAIKEEQKLESEEQASKQEGINMIPAKPIQIKKCVNKYSGSETADSEYDNISTNPETEMEYNIIIKEKSISKHHPIPQVNNYSADIEQAQEEAMKSDNSEQEGVDSHYIIVEAEVNYC